MRRVRREGHDIRLWTAGLALAVGAGAGPGLCAGALPPAARADGLDAAPSVVLPPARPWKGKSRELLAKPGDPWITPCESSGMLRTPRYDATVTWLRRLCDAAPELEMVSLGTSSEGRRIWMVVATDAGGFTPEALRAAGKPVVLVQAGIHAGEIDGKDAGLMLLRDMTVAGRRRELLERASLLFVPILSVDGHERFSAFTRINQRGPAEAGWRTNARNLNLNRDYTKLDSPEMRALVQAIVRWDPDLYVDLHVTDGADFQYDVTWGANGRPGWSPACTGWIDSVLTPAARADLERMGHVPGPFAWPLDDDDPGKGFANVSGIPRFSNAYGDARHLATVLVENHSLKSYEQRVLGTYVFLASVLRTAGSHVESLRRAARADRDRRPAEVALTWHSADEASPGRLDYLGIESRRVPSAVSGGQRTEWTGEPVTLRVPYQQTSAPLVSVRRPRAYWIPPAWGDVVERLALHGIAMQRQDAPREVEVEMYRITSARLDTLPYEGHMRIKPQLAVEHQRRTFAAGSVRVPTDQPLGDLAVLLLEPRSPDSFFQWGFFAECLQRSEYVEDYIMAPTAERMLAESGELRAAFATELRADSALAADPHARLQWFYERTPYYDTEARLYPVGREP